MTTSQAHAIDGPARCPGGGHPDEDLKNLRTLLPSGISVVETREHAPLGILLADERRLIATAAPKRALEFATGRWCARQAMVRAGIHGLPLLAKPDRSPAWPCHLVGSITHTEGYCAAAVGPRERFIGIGIDAEVAGRAETELWRLLFTLDEVTWLGQLPEQRRKVMATVLFSAKESFYKAQHSLTNAWLDFDAAAVNVEGESWSLKLVRPQDRLARMRMPVRGRFALRDGLVFTAIAIESGQVNPG